MLRLPAFFFLLACSVFAQDAPLRLVIAGLNHGHVDGFLRNATKRQDVTIVGVFDAHADLRDKYAKKYNLSADIFGGDLDQVIQKSKPEAIAIFSDTAAHAALVETAAKHKVHAMMEKPLAISMEHARRIQAAQKQSGIQVIVNYETTWYQSHGAMEKLLKTQANGPIRKMVAMDGHEGPQEIHVQPEFFAWLSDPALNGAGALFDFGCYGANLMTWMMDNHKPIAVTARTGRYKPQIYPKVDDEADVLVEYPGAIGIIQGSWNWPFSRKDFEVYTANAYGVATGGGSLRVRMPSEKEKTVDLTPLPDGQQDSISHLKGIVRGKFQPNALSSLANNMIVTEILEAARESARTGRRVELK